MTEEIIPEKRCSRCKAVKPKFYGSDTWCSDCRKEQQKTYYRTEDGNRKIRARSAAYIQTEDQKQRQREYAKQYAKTGAGRANSAIRHQRYSARLGPDGRRSKQLKVRFGLTLDEYNVMLAKQDGRCAICGGLAKQSVKGRLAVDHNHSTNRIRGLLCIQCNLGLGHFSDDPDLLANALCYLYIHLELAKAA